MQVWNMLYVTRWKYRTQKWGTKSPSAHHRTTLSGWIFATKAYINNWKKLVKQQYLFHMTVQCGKLRSTSNWDRFVSLGHPSKFQRVSRLGSVPARHSSSGRPPNFVELNIRRHLYSGGWSSRWALAHILVYFWNAKKDISKYTKILKTQCRNAYTSLISHITGMST